MDQELDRDYLSISTIDDHIAYGKEQIISHNTLHTKAKFRDKHGVELIHCGQSFIDKYLDLLEPYIATVTMTEREFLNYKYRPKALSLSYYGTTELWSAILTINHMDSVVQFNKPKMRLFTTDILEILEEILILEEENIRKNQLDMEKPIGESGYQR